MPVITIPLHLIDYPQQINLSNEPFVATLGDLHGSALKLLHFLIMEGVVTVNAADYQTFLTLYEKALAAPYLNPPESIVLPQKINKKDLAQLDEILSRIQKTDCDREVRLIGDTVRDRGANDHFTLRLFEKMEQLNIPFEIIFSNHDFEYLFVMEKFFSCDHAAQSPTKSFAKVAWNPYCASLGRFEQLYHDGLIQLDEIRRLHRVYKRHLTAIGYSIDLNNVMHIFTHAPFKTVQIKALAADLGTHYSDKTVDELAQSIDEINAAFSGIMCTDNPEEMRAFLNRINLAKTDKSHPNALPHLFDLTHNRLFYVSDDKKYHADHPDACSVTYVFGHVSPHPELCDTSLPYMNGPNTRHINLDNTMIGREAPSKEAGEDLDMDYLVLRQETRTLSSNSIMRDVQEDIADTVLNTHSPVFQVSQGAEGKVEKTAPGSSQGLSLNIRLHPSRKAV